MIMIAHKVSSKVVTIEILVGSINLVLAWMTKMSNKELALKAYSTRCLGKRNELSLIYI